MSSDNESTARSPQSINWMPELQGLRGVAAVSVVLAHWSPLPLVPSDTSYYAIFRALRATSAANLGVVFFFVLSAFLLTFLAVKEHDRTGSFSIGRFYLRRCFRIWPLYFIVLALDLLTAAGGTPGWGTPDWPWIRDHVWLWMTFVSNWSIATIGFNGHADPSTSPFRVLWSIAVEEQFYLIYPLVVSFALISSGRLKLVALASCAIALGTRAISIKVPVEPAGGMYYATTSYLDVFLAGSLCGAIAARANASWTGVIRWRGAGWILAVSLLALGVRWEQEMSYPYTRFSILIYGITGVVFALTILWILVNAQSVAGRVLRLPPLQWLGALSFGMYLLHPLVIPVAENMVTGLSATTQQDVDVRTLVQLVIYLGLVLSTALVAHLIVERPFLYLKNRLARDVTPRPSVV